MTSVVPVVCPGCHERVFSKSNDWVILCPCGTMHARIDGISVIDYEAGEFTRGGDGERAYLPFWKVAAQYTITEETVSDTGGRQITGQNGGYGNVKNITFTFPAYDLPPRGFKDIALKLTREPHMYELAKLDPSIPRRRCVVKPGDADKMADFVLVTLEAEKQGVMMELQYALTITSKKLVYLPYYEKEGKAIPAY